MGTEELESANGTEVAPAPEEFISPETDGAVNMDIQLCRTVHVSRFFIELVV